MVVLGLKNFADLPVNGVDPDNLALRGCYSLCHLEDFLLKDFDTSMSLQS